MALVAPTGRLLRVNAALSEILGYSESELLAVDFQTITHPDDLNADLGRVQALLAGEIPNYQMEKRYLRKDGGIVWALLSVSLLRDAEGEPVHFVSQILDLTRRRLAEEALRESELRHRVVTENVLDVITWIALDGTRLYISPSVRQLLGYDPEELIGKNHNGTDHPEDEALLQAAVDLVLNGAASAEVAMRKRRRDGSDAWFDIKLSEVRSPATGQLESIVAVSRDATKRRIWEQELAQARDRADRANRAKSDFLATMSHELRTPLNGVLGFAELLLDGELNSEQRQKAVLLLDAGKSLLAIIGDILDISKVEAGKLDLEHVPFGIKNVVDSAAAISGAQINAKLLTIETEFAPDLPEWVEGDPTRLRQILLNLIGNAVKFTERGRIGISVRRPAGDSPDIYRFDVVDPGAGIPADRHHLLFEPFSQTDESINRQYGGTGLGLAISKRLVEVMGGEVSVRSVEGLGSTFSFTVRLPTAGPPQPAVATPIFDGPAVPLRLLVVEDVMINQIIIDAMLKYAGHEVTVVVNGAEAIAAVLRENFDLVLMDMEMPILDGIAATVAIRALGEPMNKIPIIALTAHASTDDIARGRAAGMNDHVTKPFDRATLLRTVARWASSKRVLSYTPDGENAGRFVYAERQTSSPSVPDRR